MILRARLKPTSHIHKEWRLKALIGGQIHGVHFKWTTAREFVAVDFDLAKQGFLLNHPDIDIEMMGFMPTIIEHEPEVILTPVNEPDRLIEGPKPRGRPRKT